MIPFAISIHAPLTGSDCREQVALAAHVHFNPRSPYGERRCHHSSRRHDFLFQSTLPLRGATCVRCASGRRSWNFNPRSPYGERRYCINHVIQWLEFQSTLPLRGATKTTVTSQFTALFQSTLPLRGATLCFDRIIFDKNNFNPRSPYGERLDITWDDSETDKFQSTLPLRGATVMLF